MRRLALLINVSIMVLAVFSSVSIAGETEEEDSVKKAIEKCYVKGIHIERDIPSIKNGFHPEFNMLIYKDDKIRKFPIDDWVKSIEDSKKKNPGKPEHETTWKFPMVDVTGNAAVAKVEIYRDGKLIYTDYMSLYKFEDGWKIVNKIYFSHN